METALLDDWRSVQQLIEITLGTDQGTWWADPEFGSRLWLLRQSGKVDEAMVGSVKDEVGRSLSWMFRDGILLEAPTVKAWQVNRNRIDYHATLILSDGSEAVYVGDWHGL